MALAGGHDAKSGRGREDTLSGLTFPAETGTYDCVVEQEKSSGLGVTHDEIVLTCRVNAFVGHSRGDRLSRGGEAGGNQQEERKAWEGWSGHCVGQNPH